MLTMRAMSLIQEITREVEMKREKHLLRSITLLSSILLITMVAVCFAERYDQDELRRLLITKTPDEVMRLLGRPTRTIQTGSDSYGTWFYTDVARDKYSGKQVSVQFSFTHYPSRDMSKELMERIRNGYIGVDKDSISFY